MGLPITYLQSVLKSEEYHNPKDLEKIESLKKHLKKLEDCIERYTKNENEIQSQQNVEGFQTQDKRKTKRSRSHHGT